MWPFEKKHGRPFKSAQPTDWVLGQGERDGFPMIVRLADAYTGLAPIPSYDHHVIISVQFRNRQSNGFPSREEGDDLEALEVSVSQLLERDNETMCALVVTNNGLRDFIFYTRSVDDVRRKLDDKYRLNIAQDGTSTKRFVACWDAMLPPRASTR